MGIKKRRLGEAAFALGVVTLGLGTALTSLAGFGVSTVVAPAYVLSRAVGVIAPGAMCYICQGALIILTSLIMGRFRLKYLFSFVSAVLFGLCVDFFAEICFPALTGWSLPGRIGVFALGQAANSLGVTLLFLTYFPPQAPELFVQELCRKGGWQVYKGKYVYDLCSLALSAALSFGLLGRWDWSIMGPGTVVSALVNGPLIGLFSKNLSRIGDFGPAVKKLGALFDEK